QDVFGNTIANSTAGLSIAVTPGSGASGVTLSGTTTQSAVSGVATFADLKIDKAASGFTLTSSATGLTSATSSAFSVAPGPAAKLSFAVQPTTTSAGAAIGPAVQVSIKDAQDNVVTTATTTVTLA